MKIFSDKPQPQAKPVAPAVEHPSLWLYGILMAISIGLIWVAFSMQREPDWPGLLLNLAAGLVGSIVVLIVVDNRMRAQEVAAIRSAPARTKERVLGMVFPSRRLGADFARRWLASVEPLIQGKEQFEQFELVESKVLAGLVLVADPLTGKTTLIQMVGASLARKYLGGNSQGRVPIVFSLKDWAPGRNLDDALLAAVQLFTSCSRWSFGRLLLSGRVVVLLDGYDELWQRKLPLDAEIARLRKKYPGVVWSITSRPNLPTPVGIGDVVKLSQPDSKSESAGGDFSAH